MRESNNLGDVFDAHADTEFKARYMETIASPTSGRLF
jgi:hypothetical protein